MGGKGLIAFAMAPVLVVGGVGAAAVFGSRSPALMCASGDSGTALTAGAITGPIGEFSAEQASNAAQIMLAAQALGLSERDQQIGIMTALGESSLLVLDYGDAAGPDSRGLFQQRSAGWGSYEDRMDPFRSATSFFTVLATIADRDTMSPTEVAHAVQRNADPNHYTQWWDQAGQLLAALSVSGQRYDLGPVEPQTQALADYLGPMFGITTVGGYRATDPYPDHPSGLAADFMVPEHATGQALADYAATHADELGIDYLLWSQQSWYPGQGWQPMEDRGSPTENHEDHVHIMLKANATPLTAHNDTSLNECAAPTTEQSDQGWTLPAAGIITSGYGGRDDPTGAMGGGYVQHNGIDFAPACYAPIYAAKSGTVTQAGPASGFGNWIVLDHGNGTTSVYGHMYTDGVLVTAGQQVTAGQTIGKIGSAGDSTGCHLHFEIHINGAAIDPAPYLPNPQAL